MHLANYLGLLHAAEDTLGDAYETVSQGHGEEPEVHYTCRLLADECRAHSTELKPIVDRYGERREEEPERLYADALPGTRTGGVGLLRDLQDLYLLASFVSITYGVVEQAANGLRDTDLLDVVTRHEKDLGRQLAWLTTQLRVTAPQALLAAS